MRSIPFQSVLWGAARLLGMDPRRDLNTARAESLTEYINVRVKKGWNYDFFPEWTVSEERAMRDLHNLATAYSATNEVYFPPASKYYQALQANAGQYPATLVDGVYAVNGSYWAESQASYQPDTVWATGLVCTSGLKVLSPLNGQIYQCFTAHTAGASFDLTKFGLLTAFDPYIAYEQSGQTPIGEVKQVCKRSPRSFPSAPWPIDFSPSNHGVQLRQNAPPVVFVEFRLRPPVFTASVYSATTTYAEDALTYSTTTGECYASLIAGNVGQPVTDATKWERVQFPELLEEFVKRAVLADGLTDAKQQDRSAAEESKAFDLLDDAVDRALASQKQYPRADVSSYGR